MASTHHGMKYFTQNMQKKYNCLFELLKEIPASEFKNIEILKFKKGDILIERERHDDRLFIILEGVCNITKQFDTGLNVTYYRITTNDIIGFSELAMGASKRVACVKAQTDVVAATITRKTFLKWFSEYPDFSMKVSSQIIMRLHKTIGMFAECNNYPLYLSIITYLLYAYDFYLRQYEGSTEKKDNINIVKIDESRREMAEILGVDARSINRVVEKLKSQKIITILKGKIHIDREQYQKLLSIKYTATEL